MSAAETMARGTATGADRVRAIIGTAAARALRVLGATWRVESAGAEPTRAPFVFVGWHQGLFIGGYILRDRGLWFPVSRSRDGDIADHAIRCLGFAQSPRGSTSRGASSLLREMIRRVHAGDSGGVLPDGPRGPAFNAQPGALALASATGVPLVPMGVAAAPVARLTSWDRTIVPLPFARVRVVYGEAFHVPSAASASELEEYRRQLADRLHDIDREAHGLLRR
jgi:lysophospholipid acyltransferase (LPLAT)-like uncharacterized protein